MVRARKIAVLRGQDPKFNFMAQVFPLGKVGLLRKLSVLRTRQARN